MGDEAAALRELSIFFALTTHYECETTCSGGKKVPNEDHISRRHTSPSSTIASCENRRREVACSEGENALDTDQKSRRHTSPAANMNTKECSDSRKMVSFGLLQLREYSSTLLDHDNPSVTSGPGIAIGGNFREHDPISVDIFESRRVPRKHDRDLKLSENERIRRLLASGYRVKEIQKAMHKTQKIRMKRMKAMKKDKTIEELVSKFKKIVPSSRKTHNDENESRAFCNAAKTA